MSVAQRYCTNCGAELSEDARFCPSCGKPAHETAAVSTPEADVPVPHPPDQDQPGGFAPPPQQAGEPPRRSTANKILLYGCLGLSLIVVLILLVAGLALVAGSGGGGSNGGSSDSEEGQGAAGNQYASEIDTFTKANYGILAANPDEHVGDKVDVIGQLLDNPESSGDEVAFQMWADPEKVDWSTVVHTDRSAIGLRTDNYVHVHGEVLGSMEGENAFGGTASAVEVDADKVERVEGVDAIDPTQKTLTVDKTVENEGFSVTLQKLEFGTKHARAYISARNQGEKTVTLDFDRSKITQDDERFGNRDPYDYHLDKPKGGLPTGTETEGWVIFGCPDPSKPFQVSFIWERGGYMAKQPDPLVFQITP